jgi:beta-glucanase (GH16 family)
LRWVPGQSLTWYLDNVPVAQLTSAQAAIPDAPMDLILGLQVARASTAPWHSVVDSTTPSPSVFRVEKVDVYQ